MEEEPRSIHLLVDNFVIKFAAIGIFKSLGAFLGTLWKEFVFSPLFWYISFVIIVANKTVIFRDSEWLS